MFILYILYPRIHVPLHFIHVNLCLAFLLRLSTHVFNISFIISATTTFHFRPLLLLPSTPHCPGFSTIQRWIFYILLCKSLMSPLLAPFRRILHCWYLYLSSSVLLLLTSVSTCVFHHRFETLGAVFHVHLPAQSALSFCYYRLSSYFTLPSYRQTSLCHFAILCSRSSSGHAITTRSSEYSSSYMFSLAIAFLVHLKGEKNNSELAQWQTPLCLHLRYPLLFLIFHA